MPPPVDRIIEVTCDQESHLGYLLRPSVLTPAQYGALLAVVARQLGIMFAHDYPGLMPADVTEDIAVAFAHELSAGNADATTNVLQ